MNSPAPDVRAAIVRAAKENGVDPRFALAVAERESSFNPSAHASKSMFGLFQMSGALRKQYGSGDSADPYVQASAWMPFIKDTKAQMARKLGRDPTDAEAYTGHYYGPTRAARTLMMDPSTPVDAVFTPQEMEGNPQFARAGTIGKLNASVMGDVSKRMARFGGQTDVPAPAEPADLSAMGTPVASPEDAPSMPQASSDLAQVPSPPTAPDLSSFGDPVEPSVTAPSQSAQAAPVDLSSFGTPVV